MKVSILKPYGFCAGVEYVINYLNNIINLYPNKKIYCVGSLVHNELVVKEIENRGVFVMSGDKSDIIDSISDGVVVFSAHGTDEKIKEKAQNKGLIVHDAACPFVKREHSLIKEYLKKKYKIIFIGVPGHDEANAVMSLSADILFISSIEDVDTLEQSLENVVVINQTTLSYISLEGIHNKIKQKFPEALFLNEICNSSRIRQTKLTSSINNYDLIIVVGDKTSNNTASLYKIATEYGKDTIYTNDENDSRLEQILNKESVLIVSGASTPKEKVEKIAKKLKSL